MLNLARLHRICSPQFTAYRKMTSSASMAGNRTYADAVDCLNSLQSNAATIEKIRATGATRNDKLIPETIDYLNRIGYQAEDLNALNVLHITGTKGKGSTSAFCSSLLTTLAPKAKIGLYTSPHMVSVCERIRINGQPLSEDKFAKYFFEVWDKFEQNTKRLYSDTGPKPAYFRYLTIMAYHVFLREKVDATILEVGIGGTYDSTNIVPKPLVTGVTTLGIDHIFVLGKTIEEIAYHKGGIFKKDTPALTVAGQPPAGLEVLHQRAEELHASNFTVVEEKEQLKEVKLGLAGNHQKVNASLALALVQTFLSSPNIPSVFSNNPFSQTSAQPSTSNGDASHLPSLSRTLNTSDPLAPVALQALKTAKWPGRCQTIQDRSEQRKGVTWYLDGAHTVESVELCAEWFTNEAFTKERTRKRVLMFNCTSGRSAASLLGTLSNTMAAVNKRQHLQPEEDSLFDHVIFCTNVTYADGGFKSELSSKAVSDGDLAHLTVQKELAEAWNSLSKSSDSEVSPATQVHVLPSIQNAVEIITQVAHEGPDQGVDVLVAGSLHLVGGVFEVAKLQFAL